MAGWVLPALKAILPHVGTIVEAAKPVFRRSTASGETRQTVEEQIAELQLAITQNADHITALAEQLHKTVAVLEEGVKTSRQKLMRLYVLSGTAIAISVISLGIAVYIR
jgi:hypothetical protein